MVSQTSAITPPDPSGATSIVYYATTAGGSTFYKIGQDPGHPGSANLGVNDAALVAL